MTRRTIIALCCAVPLAALVVFAALPDRRQRRQDGVTVTQGDLEVWSVYEGTLDARHVDLITSAFNGSATVAELAEEGQRVQRGELLVRFDDSLVKRDLLRSERDYALAKAEMEGLEQAKLPLESRQIRLRLVEAKAQFDDERRFLDDSLELRKEDLVSEQEVEQQRAKVERLRSALAQIAMESKLTKAYLHPAALERAHATLSAAEQAVTLARQQLMNCTVRAPSAGIVVHRSLHIGTDYRTVRVGDTLHRNQPFMAIPDMNEVVVHSYVPEAELALVEVGSHVVVTPLAYPDLRLPGKVETVGSMAQAVPGKPAWQKYFRVVIGITKLDPKVRSGMSAHARVLSHRRESAVLIRRSHVRWEQGRSFCLVRRALRPEKRMLQLGKANLTHYEVLEGLAPGEIVLTP